MKEMALLTYEHTHTQTHTDHLNPEVKDLVVPPFGEWVFPAQRARMQRLRWLYQFIESNGGALENEVKFELMSRFGLTARTAGEYLRTLAAKYLIVNFYGRWVTSKAFHDLSR